MELEAAFDLLYDQLRSSARSERQAKMFAASQVMLRQIALVSPEPADHPSLHAHSSTVDFPAAWMPSMMCHSDKPIFQLCNHLQQLAWLAMIQQLAHLSCADGRLSLPAIS